MLQVCKKNVIEYERNTFSMRKGYDMENNKIIDNVQPQPQAQPQPAPGPVQPPVYQEPAYPQSVYQQPVQYQQVPPAYSMPPYQADPSMQASVPTEEEKANKKKANILCIISLALMILPSIVSGALSGITNAFDDLSGESYEALETFVSIALGGLGASYIASWVLMLIARIKYKTTFSKVLMWIYIGLLAAGLIGVILLVVMCAYIIQECNGF